MFEAMRNLFADLDTNDDNEVDHTEYNVLARAAVDITSLHFDTMVTCKNLSLFSFC